MPTSCCVVGCRSSGYKDGRKFSAFPMLQHRSATTLELSLTRQKAWQTAINRSGFGSDKFKHARVCDLHFVSGRSVKLSEVGDVDWVPTLNLGYSNELTELVNYCRLCLGKHDDHSVNLFSKQDTEETETDDLLVCEMVETFCNIKVTKDDRLSECICNNCWNVISSMHQLRIVSLKSEQDLIDILKRHSSSTVTAPKQSETCIDFKIEFIDTQSTEDKESLKESLQESEGRNESDDDVTTVEHKTEPRKKAKEKKKRGERKYGEDKISCEMCGKLVEPKLIEYHLNAHNDIRPYKCQATDCEKHFTAPALAQHHYRKVHVYSITRPKKCDICGKGFIQQSSLLTHRSYHFDPEIPCTICGQLYRNKRALQRHLLVHSGERKYSCSECNKSFQTGFTLKTHMRIHTLEKPFQCMECTKSFAYKCLLKGHIEKHHPKQSGQP